MSILHKASIQYLVRHRWQMMLALLGICAGVAVMVAIDLASQSARSSFTRSVAAINGTATHHVFGGPGGLREQVYVDLRVQHGIDDVSPLVTGFIRVGETSLQLIGVDVFAEQGFQRYSAVENISQGVFSADDRTDYTDPQLVVRKMLTAGNAVFLSATAANELGLKPGQHFELVVNGKVVVAELANAIGSSGDSQLDKLAIVDIGVAQEWLGMVGKLSRIDLNAADRNQVEKISSLLPAEVTLVSATSRLDTTAAMSDAFMTNLTAMSLLALLVGLFLIYNSVAFTVLQRRDLIGILRALGVTRREIFAVVMLEALTLGVIGAICGIIVGILLGGELLGLVARTISDHYFAVNVDSLSLSTAALVKGLLAGVAATLIAAAIPAGEASRVQPRMALTRSVVEGRYSRLAPRAATIGLFLIVIAVLALTLSRSSLLTGLVGIFGIVLGYALCIPLFVTQCVTRLAPLAKRIGGSIGTLAVRSIAAALSRTGVAIVSLSIAIAATIGISIMVVSFRSSVGDWLDATLQSDIYVGVSQGDLDHDLLMELVEIPGVLTFSTARRSRLESEGEVPGIFALGMGQGVTPGFDVRSNDPAGVWRQFQQRNTVLVSDPYAFNHGVSTGDTVVLNTVGGPTGFLVVGIYRSYEANAGVIVMSRSNYDAHFEDDGVDSIGLYLEPGADPDVVMEDLRSASEGQQSLLINSNDRIREFSLNVFDRTFLITDILYWLVTGIAFVGILGAMLAFQLERGREFAILRALGMTPGQVGGLVTAQSALMGLLSGIAAIPLGIVMAVLLIVVINRRSFGWQMDIEVSLLLLGVTVLFATVVATIAGLFPAWRASRSYPALAIREE